MIVRNLSVGKGLQAYRLFSEPMCEQAPVASGTADLTSQEVESIFYDRFMAAAEKTAELAGAATLDSAADPIDRPL